MYLKFKMKSADKYVYLSLTVKSFEFFACCWKDYKFWQGFFYRLGKGLFCQ